MKEGMSATAEEPIERCRAEIARYKAPRTIVFAELPRTSTGKVRKNLLRERARALEGGRPEAWSAPVRSEGRRAAPRGEAPSACHP
jgi:acyl-CoA synthetase (AMP-forming)/AMP-acid ligase II